MGKKFDVVVTQRYESRGEQKKRYVNIGAVIETDKGFSLKLESVPVGWDGWAQFYEPKPREERQPSRSQDSNNFDDTDLPF